MADQIGGTTPLSGASRFDERPSVSNHFSWMRTWMSIQRTQMSAVRTATALIGFGFTVAQFFEKLQTKVPGLHPIDPGMPRNVGLLLIAAGVLFLLLSTWQYHRALEYMRSEPFGGIAVPAERAMQKPSYIVSYAVLLIGVIAFASVLLRF